MRIGAALTVSYVAVPVGLGFGGPHLADNGLTGLAAAGALAVVGGLTLFGSAIAWTVTSARFRVSVPASVAAIVALVVVSFTLGQAVAATNVPRTDIGRRTPADEGVEFRDVTFLASDATPLSGWFVPTSNGAAVVLAHGAGSTRSDVLDHAVVLARNGFGVLLFDARGHGRSAGRAMDFGWYGDSDIAGATSFVAVQPGVDPERIAVVGMSMGGEEAIGAAGSNESIRAVVAEGATNRVAGDKAWLSERYGVRGALTELFSTLTTQFTDLLTAAHPPVTLRDAARSGVPTLLIAAGDVPDEAHAARYIQSASPGTVDVWVAPETQHTAALRTHPQEWEARVVGFLNRALHVRPIPAG